MRTTSTVKREEVLELLDGVLEGYREGIGNIQDRPNQDWGKLAAVAEFCDVLASLRKDIENLPGEQEQEDQDLLRTPQDLADWLGAAVEDLNKVIYKNTRCGAWCCLTKEGGVRIGSTVEGVDQSTETVNFLFPFTREEFDEAVKAVEEEAEEIWNATHGCEDCGAEDEGGYRRINPTCPTCGGEGCII